MPAPQQERSSLTRTKVLDAAVDSLVDVGFTSTSAALVADRAGVSRGAMQYHFPTRHDLMAATVEHLVDRIGVQLAQVAGGLPPVGEPERFPAAVDALWASASEPLFVAWLELTVAARADTTLSVLLRQVRDRLFTVIAEAGCAMFGTDSGDEEAGIFIEMTLALFTGLALVRYTGLGRGPNRARRERQILEAWKATAPLLVRRR